MIRPSNSPFYSSVLLSLKKNGSWRICISCRALNKMTIENHFTILRINEILDSLRGAKIFSKVDLKSGYHQVPIAPPDIHKTTFMTPQRLYEYLVIPFGLSNAPTIFNRMISRIFKKHRKFISTFFNDILSLQQERRGASEAIYCKIINCIQC